MALDILVVDDEADIRMLVADILEDEGYACRVAAGSDSALAAVEERLPGHQVRPGIKVVEVAEEITAGVSDPAIALDETGENFGGEPDVITVILRRYPQTEDFGPVGGHDLLWGNDVPQRLGHLPALSVYDKAVSQDLLIGRPIPRPHRGQEGTMEPAPVLITPLEIHLCRPS